VGCNCAAPSFVGSESCADVCERVDGNHAFAHVQAVNEAQEEFDFLDDQNINLTTQRDARIKEDNMFGFPAKEEDSNEEDVCKFEGGDDYNNEDVGE
jgi:hypothetical protein